MTDHEHFQELISEKLDGIISAADDRLLADHMASCEDCRELYSLLSGAREALDFELEPPEALLPGVMKAVRAEKRRKNFRVQAAFTGFAAAAAVLAVVLFTGGPRLPEADLADPGSALSSSSDPGSPLSPSAAPPSTYALPGADEPRAQADDPAFCFTPADGSGVSLPVEDGPDVYPSIESRDVRYRAIARFETLPEEITSGTLPYLFSDGSTGYDLTEEQFESLLDSALSVDYPDPDGDVYMAVLVAE